MSAGRIRANAVKLSNKGRSDLNLVMRAFPQKFGYRVTAEI